MSLLQEIKGSGVVAIIRGATIDNIIPISKALREGGVKTLEITVETPNVLSIIEKASTELDGVIVGAGTVLDPETARAAILSGAKFVFSPTVNTETIRMTKRYGVISISGALTPTEILTAYEHGSDVIKVFPANVFGPTYLKDVHGPLPHIPLMPTGGINLSNTADYIKAGGVAVGLGSSLVNTKLEMNEKTLADLTAKSKEFVNEVQKARR
ncbi:bifunctional 4-hydroxy-2-oxoglutarate aldolase/2-dehydro-3-deoxy-phosphogluconate aldolase [Halalkalibacter alkaliphilus]|uniref:Bifunctional 4-hydroxy-2-oxoglutarate aldolase/2-dehydro-3-deoxy-phosphogluconate aldolase n=1 Tax=Halalkalibacter alkaliphilus TaxID=2917993 RepID=A0A9X1ZUH4_9BACI|nr:bifunctional 4-hydroxy-2-oxoglutarate aldolase/2-dehydro-3-deoxy-phosphogluconate aldolase [Halalkalibacter alkaliphilus]MCL7745734.1 bifunctional 4-hydroxy-2-oxoglutarate aldolase/2-dehydro-3-deoxy-phosphogluconate aldolase [Halalkalibacter alkaliphilus]